MKFENKIIEYIENNFNFGKVIGNPKFPKQGLSSKVFFLSFSSSVELVVKHGESVDKDLFFLKILEANNSTIPVPTVHGFFTIENIHILLLQKIKGELFGDIEVNDLSKYFETVINTLSQLHKVKNENTNWKGYLLNIFNGTMIDWEKGFESGLLDNELVKKSLRKIQAEINKLNIQKNTWSLLHTDFNQGNLFVDKETFTITGLIDWEEATFGDPIYDFARFHLHLWHRNVNPDEIQHFLNLLNLSPDELGKENIYFISFVIHYLAYYSESQDDFSLGRIKKHQNFLSKWVSENFE